MSKSGKKDSAELDTSKLPPLPKGWCWRLPHDICEVVASGSTPSSDKMYDGEGEIPFIKVYNLTHDGSLNFSYKPTFIDRRVHEGLLARSRVLPDDVLMNIVGPPLGKVSIVPDDFPEWNINQAIVTFRPGKAISGRYLAAALLTDSIISRVTSLAKATAGQHNIGVSMCRSLLPIPLAPLPEQRRIVAKIEELFSDLDAGVAALQRAKAKLKRYRAAVLKAAVEGRLTEPWRKKHRPKETGQQLLERILRQRRLKWEEDQSAAYAKAGKTPPANWKQKYKEPAPPDTTNLPELPEGWCWATVDQIAAIQGGIQKQPKRKPCNNAYPFLRVANVYRDRLDLSEVHKIELFGDEIERLRLGAGDLLVVEGNGSKTEIGRSALWSGEISDCVHQNHIIRVRLLAGTPKYLNSYWNSPEGNGRVMQVAASSSGLYTLSVAKVSSLPLPLPPDDEQNQIISEVEQRLSVLEEADTQIHANLTRSTRLRQSILKRAFEGKLVPQDPADEPASVLLDRVRAQRSNGDDPSAEAAPSEKPRKRGSRQRGWEGDGNA